MVLCEPEVVILFSPDKLLVLPTLLFLWLLSLLLTDGILVR